VNADAKNISSLDSLRIDVDNKDRIDEKIIKAST